MKKFAIILSGCGVFDGAEIHESVLTMLAVDQNGCSYTVFAPDIYQHHVVDHLSGKETGEKRNILTESARIARGNIKALKEFRAEDFDALILPGGFGAAKNLSSFAFDGADMNVNEELKNAILSMSASGKPVGAMCIAPVILARLFPDAQLTIGNDNATATHIEKMGSRHITASHSDVVIDKKNKLFTTPCYMFDVSVTVIASATDKLVKEMLKYIQP